MTITKTDPISEFELLMQSVRDTPVDECGNHPIDDLLREILADQVLNPLYQGLIAGTLAAALGHKNVPAEFMFARELLQVLSHQEYATLDKVAFHVVGLSLTHKHECVREAAAMTLGTWDAPGSKALLAAFVGEEKAGHLKKRWLLLLEDLT